MSKIVISDINNIIQLALPKQLVIFSKSILQYYKPCSFFGCEKKKTSAYFCRSGIKSPGPRNKRTARSTNSANFLRVLQRCVDPLVAGILPAQGVLTCDPECVPTSLLSGARDALITSHSGLGSGSESSLPDTKKTPSTPGSP